MIGVACAPDERVLIAELFQLFKTPWCFLEDGHEVDAIIATDCGPIELRARVVLAFAARRTWLDDSAGIATGEPRSSGLLATAQDSIPIHGSVLPLPSDGAPLARLADTGEPAVVEVMQPQGVLVRFGYDLVAELRALLGPGQDATRS